MDGMDVPLVDIGGFDNGSPEDRSRIASEVAEAVETIGFLSITGHGVPVGLMKDMRQQFWNFYDLSMEEKRKAINPSMNLNRGYAPPGGQSIATTEDGKPLPDLREAYPFGRFDLPDDPYYAAPDAAYAYEPNIWPVSSPGFEETTKAYYQALEALNLLMLRIFATALDLDEGFFLDKFDKHASVLRGMNYFDQEEDPRPGQLRCAAHADYGTHTFLQIENAPGGLQVLNRAGDWVDVDPAPGTFVVNIGDLMMNWTNDRWLSNQHRVVNPPLGLREGTRRQSIAFFVQPNYDAVIECIETCKKLGDAAKHPPVKAWEHRYAMLNNTVLKPQDAPA
ncbi:MAG: isopenicillin N synthase family oxygenase [Rhodospirillaceae bacterium]|jgi:isopenicillin N synthase-like dioxygenase|nr:isopenicillin N synthase family oxygenase [Rhodospirillaceae bacterium]MBT5459873.1 isopenicillin N synthase family oxygenase [Rhodospirillaceae bacterium]